MAYTADQLRTQIQTLETALVRGERQVQFSDRMVTYNSAAEIEERIRYFKSLLVDSAGGRSRQSFGVSVKGF